MTRKAGRRKRLAQSIYQDAYGISTRVMVRGHSEERRYPLGTPLSTIRRDLEIRRQDLNDIVPSMTRGSFAYEVERYLEALPDGGYKHERRDLLAAWTKPLGAKPLAMLTRAELVEVLDGWARDGQSPSRQNKRISALRVLWRRVAPERALPHPIERIPRRSEPKAQLDRSLDVALVERVLDAVPEALNAGGDCLARVRLRALFWTGQPRALLRLVQPEHVRWEATPPELYVQPRRKGAGVDAAWIPLVPQAVTALKALFAAQAHGGDWHKGSLRLSWRRAVTTVQAALRAEGRPDDAARLADSRVYDLRHSFLTALGKASGDLYAVAEVARHSDLRTTQRYLRGASSVRMKAAIDALTQSVTEHRPPRAERVPKKGSQNAGRKVERKLLLVRKVVQS
jgi:integrase